MIGRQGIGSAIGSDEGRRRVASLSARLDLGETPASIASAEGASASEILAAIAWPGLDGDGPPLVRSDPRRPRPDVAGPAALAEVFPSAPRTALLGLSAGLLQVVDWWDASHEAAQEADDLGEHAFAPYWHAIAHRREPDAGNAAYWFRRVGRHPAFADVEDAARALLASHADPGLTARLLPGGSWDPRAFVAACGEAARRPGSDLERLARRIQRAEMIALLDATTPPGHP